MWLQLHNNLVCAVAPFAVTEDAVIAGYAGPFDAYVAAIVYLLFIHSLNPL